MRSHQCAFQVALQQLKVPSRSWLCLFSGGTLPAPKLRPLWQRVSNCHMLCFLDLRHPKSIRARSTNPPGLTPKGCETLTHPKPQTRNSKLPQTARSSQRCRSGKPGDLYGLWGLGSSCMLGALGGLVMWDVGGSTRDFYLKP